ncbi:alpha/beta hydrolase [Variovorax sp. KK3]|uniref:alpha/beta hydrolase n=1 Tax=Variovorax sp. KK3 TaxID=1855728 RepID=UPI00097C8FD1|nr:alpha/beta hydrolase [Variovorax sp. KK3]
MAGRSFRSVTQVYGSRFDPEVLAATVQHWAPRVDAQAKAATTCIADVAYGDHPRHRIDLFPAKGPSAPVVLFVHGGGFVAGDKQVAPPFYANVGRFFAAHGMLGACMNYRRAPVGGWPAGAQDLEAAVQWLLQRADLYGGDAKRLVVIGQSAGACHLATWLFDPAFAGGARDRVLAAALMSGFYQAAAPLSDGQRAYFGDDPALYAQRSPLTHARLPSHPLLVTLAEYDPPDLRRQSQDLVEALSRGPAKPQVADLAGHNHVSPLMSLGSDDGEVGLLLRRFIARVAASPLAD